MPAACCCSGAPCHRYSAFSDVRNPTGSKIAQEWVSRAGLPWCFGSIDASMGSNEWWRMFLAGGVGALASRVVTAPMARVRLIMQAQGQASGSFTAVAARILQRDGIAAFWRSNWASMLQVFPHGATICVAYGTLSAAAKSALGRDLNAHERAGIGATAGAAATLVTHPLELIRTRMAVQRSGPDSAAAQAQPAAAGAGGMFGSSRTAQAPGKPSADPLPGGGASNLQRLPQGATSAAASGAAGSTGSITSMPLKRVVGSAGAGRTFSAPAGAAGEPVGMPCVRRTNCPAAGPQGGSGGAARLHTSARALAAAAEGSSPATLRSALSGMGMSASGGGASTFVSMLHTSVRSHGARLERAVGGSARAYDGVRDAARRIWSRDGVVGFYRGLGPALLGATVFTGTMQSAFDTIVSRARAPAGVAGVHWQQQDMYLTGGAGLAAGCIAHMAVHPIDTVKRRMMMLRSHSAGAMAPMQVARRVVSQEGWRALYAGLGPGLLNVAPAVMISLGVRDLVLGRLSLGMAPACNEAVHTERRLVPVFVGKLAWWRRSSPPATD